MGEYTIQEIHSQPEIWDRTLELVRQAPDPIGKIDQIVGDRPVLFTGCGSSYYLSLASAAAWSAFGAGPSMALSATEVAICPACYFAAGARGATFAVSRSGKTPETRDAARYTSSTLGWPVLAVTHTPESPIVGEYADTLLLDFAGEKSRFMTRALTSAILAFQYLAAKRARRADLAQELEQLPKHAERLIHQYGPVVEQMGFAEKPALYVYLGHGPYYGLAAEAMLKVKEMARTPAEAYHSLEYWHGPRYAGNASTLIWLFLSDAASKYEFELLPKLKSLGARIAVICEQAGPEVTSTADFVFELHSGLSDYTRMLLVMPIVQLFAYYSACAAGVTVD